MSACQCERAAHDEAGNGHAYLGVDANPHRVAMFVGPVCDDCADGHLADVMRHCGRCGSPDHWTEDHQTAPTWSKPCSCGAIVERYRGQSDVMCSNCGAWYNAGGQQLRVDWQSNPSTWDEDVSDLDGYELAALRSEQ